MSSNINKQKTQETLELLNQAVADMFTSEKYLQYLNFMSSMHQYSVRNLILCFFQRPDVSCVGSFGFWKKHDFHIKKGEKGMRIFAPVKCTGYRTVIREDGETEAEEYSYIRFKPEYVFDVAQTIEGPASLPKLVTIPVFSSAELDAAALRLIESGDGKYMFDDALNASTANGYFSPTSGEIHIASRLAPAANPDGGNSAMLLRVLIHEKAHELLHSEDNGTSRELRELEAESAAYCVCRRILLGSEALSAVTADYSIGYLASWADNREQPLDALIRSVDRISAATEQLLQWVSSVGGLAVV